MAATKLTSKFVESAKPNPGRQTAYPDAQVPGLELRVSGQGRKSWSLRYRARDGRQSRVSLGTFPAVDLGEARSAALREMGAVAAGADPAGERRRSRHLARSQPIVTFSDLADAYLAACTAGEWKPKNRVKRERTMADEKGILRRHIRPAIGSLRVEEVSRPVVKKMLRGMVTKGIGAQTNRTQAVVRQCFAWAIAEERVQVNPATGFAPLATETPRARVLRDAELRLLWDGLLAPEALRLPAEEGAGGRVYVGRPLAIILQLCGLLLQRKSEIAGMRVDELDLDHRTWLIGADRMKGGRPHLVPLPPRAVGLIKEALALAAFGRKAAPPVVFPSSRDDSKPTRGDSVTHAMAGVAKALRLDDVTVHDLRRTGATLMTSERLGVAPFIRSQVLGHRGDTGGGAAVSSTHYDWNTYAAEKRRALEAWEGLLLEIVGDRQATSKVTHIRAAR